MRLLSTEGGGVSRWDKRTVWSFLPDVHLPASRSRRGNGWGTRRAHKWEPHRPDMFE